MTGRPDKPAQLHALTSLRFFAAAMIVAMHSQGTFGIPKHAFSGLPLEQGVSFFFVLSGFILTYVYPDLSASGAKAHFLWARIARIWPVHLATLGLAFLLLPQSHLFPFGGDVQEKAQITAANAFLLQSLIPNIKYYFSVNAVSWSISTELFFYLGFTLLIVGWARNWHWKLGITASLLIGLCLLCNLLEIPGYKAGYQGVTIPGLTYVNPIARVFEFSLGMATALLFRRLSSNGPVSRPVATAIELATIGLTVAVLYAVPGIEQPASQLFGKAFALWLGNGGGAILFSALILIFALGGGWLSRLLSMRFFVLLGEISFSLYMVHQIFIRMHLAHDKEMLGMETWQIYPLFWAVSLATSYFLWRLVEMPARAHLVALWRRPGRRTATT